MIRRPPRSTLSSSSAASDVYKRQKESRLRLLTAARTQIEPIFLLYDDPERCEQALREQAAVREPDLDAEELGVRSRLWRVDDAAALERVHSALADKQLLIA